MDRFINDVVRFPGRTISSSFLRSWGDLPESANAPLPAVSRQSADDSKVFTMQNDSPKELITPADSLYLSGTRINQDKE
jgi:hypothetical protein